MTADGSAAVIAWLRSPEGEEWSRSRALAGSAASLSDIIAGYQPAEWRAQGPLDVASDPCGWTAVS